MLLTPPPFVDPDALVTVGETPIDGPAAGPRAVRYATFEAWRERAGSLAVLEAVDGTNLTLTELGAAEDGGVGSDPQRQRQHGGSSEGGSLAELAQAESKFLCETREPIHDSFPSRTPHNAGVGSQVHESQSGSSNGLRRTPRRHESG